MCICVRMMSVSALPLAVGLPWRGDAVHATLHARAAVAIIARRQATRCAQESDRLGLTRQCRMRDALLSVAMGAVVRSRHDSTRIPSQVASKGLDSRLTLLRQRVVVTKARSPTSQHLLQLLQCLGEPPLRDQHPSCLRHARQCVWVRVTKSGSKRSECLPQQCQRVAVLPLHDIHRGSPGTGPCQRRRRQRWLDGPPAPARTAPAPR